MTDALTALNPTASQTTSDTASVQLAENFEMFLTLLTEQLQNQDPLNPLDSNEFTSQLVEFASVEQQIAQTNELEKLNAAQASAANVSAVSYLGQTVRVTGAEAPLVDGDASWAYVMPPGATTATITVRDAEGRAVATADAERSEGTHTFSWDGTTDAGEIAEDGAYSLSIEANDVDGEPLSAIISGRGVVTGVDFTGASPSVTLGPVRAALSAVEAVGSGA